MLNTAKSTISTNQKKLWKVFTRDGKELFAYTVEDEFEDEMAATIRLLAYENKCSPHSIHVHRELR